MFIAPVLGGIFLVVNTTANCWTFITELKRNYGVVWSVVSTQPTNIGQAGESFKKVLFLEKMKDLKRH